MPTKDDDTGTIHIEDESLRPGFVITPKAFIARTDLSPGAKLTLLALLSFAWEKDSCFPGQERLAQAIGMSKRSIPRYIKELEDAKVVSHQQRGLNKTNLYTIHRLADPGIANLANPVVTGTVSPELPGWQGKKNKVNKIQKKGIYTDVSSVIPATPADLDPAWLTDPTEPT